jgi:succinate dehydrogenase hydrophobic anchor subunit
MGSIFDDTLKSPNGKWSRKSLTMLTSFAISILLGAYIVISDYLLEEEVNRYAIEVFSAFMILTGTLSGVTVLDKKFESKEKTDPEV